jgi:O-methyltransferase domain
MAASSAESALAPAQLVGQIATGYIASAALQVALHLEIPDRLAAGPQSVSDLARAAGVQEDPLYRVLRMLASVGVFEERSPRTFASNAPADLLRKGHTTLRDIHYFLTDPLHFRVYGDLMHSVATGQPAIEKVGGATVFEYFATHPDDAARFNNGMTSLSANAVAAALTAYDFADINVLVDVAGGHGMVLTSILRQYPRMRGVLFDLEHVIVGAPPLIERAGVTDRCQTMVGDFFTAVPPGGDAYIMKHIIHDWDDERALVILRNIHRVLQGTPRGRVILLEAVVQPANQADFGKLLDLEMLVFPGGRERTAEEFESLFARAGFTLTRIVPTQSPLSVIEAHLSEEKK